MFVVYLSEPISGMHSPLSQQSWNEHFPRIFTGSSGFCSLILNFATKMADLEHKSSRNLATVISAACDLNERGGKHRLFQTSPEPDRYRSSVNVWNHPVLLTQKKKKKKREKKKERLL